MTIETLDHKLNKVITHYTMRIAEQYDESNTPLTYKDAIEIAKETSDHLALFKQEILRFLQGEKNTEE